MWSAERKGDGCCLLHDGRQRLALMSFGMVQGDLVELYGHVLADALNQFEFELNTRMMLAHDDSDPDDLLA